MLYLQAFFGHCETSFTALLSGLTILNVALQTSSLSPPWTSPSWRTCGCRTWRSGTCRASRPTPSCPSWRASGWTPATTAWCTPSPAGSPSSAPWGSTPSHLMFRCLKFPRYKKIYLYFTTENTLFDISVSLSVHFHSITVTFQSLPKYKTHCCLYQKIFLKIFSAIFTTYFYLQPFPGPASVVAKYWQCWSHPQNNVKPQQTSNPNFGNMIRQTKETFSFLTNW